MRYDSTVISYSIFGGHGREIIVAAELTIRTEMFKINTLQPNLTGWGILKSVWKSNAVAARLPQQTRTMHTSQRTRRLFRLTVVLTPVRSSEKRRHFGETIRVGRAGEIFRLFADCRRKWGDSRKRLQYSRSRNPPPGLQKREKERSADRADKLRPVGQNPCSGAATIAIATCGPPREFRSILP